MDSGGAAAKVAIALMATQDRRARVKGLPFTIQERTSHQQHTMRRTHAAVLLVVGTAQSSSPQQIFLTGSAVIVVAPKRGGLAICLD